MVSWLCGIEGAATHAEGHSARKRKGSWSQPSEREREGLRGDRKGLD
jgi:hypothetical protein